MTGQLRAIWRKRAKRGPMDPQTSAVLVAGRGLEGNANQGGKRQVTIIEEERWTEATNQIGVDVPPASRRANLMITGLHLEGTRGQILRVGPTRLQIWMECTPCERMDAAQPGLQEALRPHWRGGACAQVLEGGEIRVGDEVAWEEPSP